MFGQGWRCSRALQQGVGIALLAAAVSIFPATFSPAAAEAMSPQQQFAFDIYKELVEINTATGDTALAAEAMAARLRTAGFADEDIHVFSPAPHKGNLVARLRGSGARKPILLLAHLDVVPANREDWSVDPFKLTSRTATIMRAQRRRQIHGGGLRHQSHSLQAGGLQARSAISSSRSRPTRKSSTAMRWGSNGCSRIIVT